MEINAYELVELLDSEIFKAQVRSYPTRFDGTPRSLDTFVELQWGDTNWVTLEWEGNQVFYIYASGSDDLELACSVSVDEILDIVLQAQNWR